MIKAAKSVMFKRRASRVNADGHEIGSNRGSIRSSLLIPTSINEDKREEEENL